MTMLAVLFSTSPMVWARDAARSGAIVEVACKGWGVNRRSFWRTWAASSLVVRATKDPTIRRTIRFTTNATRKMRTIRSGTVASQSATRATSSFSVHE